MMNFTRGVVDDDEGILYTVKAMAASLGWSIRAASDPFEALDWVKRHLVDILLVDYHMPVMSGLEVVRQARQLSQNVILLALTVEESPEIARELLLAGADDFISKPLRLADFSARITLHTELLRYRLYENREGRSKGLSEDTARRVYDLFENGEDLTASETADRSGLAYPTAHRYLEYLVRKGQLNRRSEVDDNRSGRPRTIYSSPQYVKARLPHSVAPEVAENPEASLRKEWEPFPLHADELPRKQARVPSF